PPVGRRREWWCSREAAHATQGRVPPAGGRSDQGGPPALTLRRRRFVGAAALPAVAAAEVGFGAAPPKPRLATGCPRRAQPDPRPTPPAAPLPTLPSPIPALPPTTVPPVIPTSPPDGTYGTFDITFAAVASGDVTVTPAPPPPTTETTEAFATPPVTEAAVP